MKIAVIAFLFCVSCVQVSAQIHLHSLRIELDSVIVKTIKNYEGRFDSWVDTSIRYSYATEISTSDSIVGSSSFYHATGNYSPYPYPSLVTWEITIVYDSSNNTVVSLDYFKKTTIGQDEDVLTETFKIQNVPVVTAGANNNISEFSKYKINSSDFSYSIKELTRSGYPFMDATTQIDTTSYSTGSVLFEGALPLEVKMNEDERKEWEVVSSISNGTIIINNRTKHHDVVVLNLDGAIIEKYDIRIGLNSIATSLRNGFYFIQLGKTAKKILIQK